jgi:hypothetical protein
MKNSENIQKANGRKTTSLIKKMMKEKFGIKITVQSDSYSMGSSLNVKYDLGVDSDKVEAILNNLQYGRFNGMEDIYEINQEKTGLVYDGYQLDDFKFVFVRQHISNELRKQLYNLYRPLFSYDQPEFKYDQDFDRHFQVRNFVTQNESEITLIKAVFNFDHQDVEFIYEVNGVQYSTRSLEPIAPASKTIEEAKSGIAEEVEKMVQLFAKIDMEQKGEVSESVKECARVQGVKLEESAPVNEDVVQLVDYSEKAFAVIGLGTKKIKEDLMRLFGKYNRNLKCGPGYIFSKKHLEKVTEFLNSKK